MADRGVTERIDDLNKRKAQGLYGTIVIIEVSGGVPDGVKCFTREQASTAEEHFIRLIEENEKFDDDKTPAGTIEDYWSEGHYERHNYEIYFLNSC
jgi:hypothetical protein